MPVAEVVGEFVPRALHGPAFHPPIIALKQADQIEQLPAAHRIMHEWPPGPTQLVPTSSLIPAGTRSRGTSPRQATMPVNSGRSAPNDRKAHARLHAVGTDDKRRVTVSPRSNSIGDGILVLRDAGAFAIEVDRIRPLAPDGVEQRGMQVAAVEHHVGESVALDRHRAEIEQLPGLAGAPEPDLLAGDDDAEPFDRSPSPSA